MNKKGAGLNDFLLIGVGFFVLAFVGVISIFVATTINGAFQDTPELGTVAVQSSQDYTSLFTGVIDYAILLWIGILVLGSAISSYLVSTRPIFFILFIVATILTSVALLPFSVMFSEFTESGFSSAVASMPIVSFISNNILLFIVGYLVLIGTLLYAKPGGGGLFG